MRYKAKIIYRIRKNHPDLKYIDNWNKNKFYEIEDIYMFDDNWRKEDCFYYIKKDLQLIAGDGYISDYIFDIKEY